MQAGAYHSIFACPSPSDDAQAIDSATPAAVQHLAFPFRILSFIKVLIVSASSLRYDRDISCAALRDCRDRDSIIQTFYFKIN